MQGDRHVRFAILGSLELLIDDRPANLGGTTPRTLLAMLLLHINQPVRSDALIAGLWGDGAPPSAINSLHSHISRLRRLLSQPGDEVRIDRHAGGYLLGADPERLDARRFDRLIAESGHQVADGSPERGATLLHEALGLWRGPALDEFAGAEFARGEAVRLDGLRLEATGRVVDLELDLGAHASLVPELERLVTEHPLQERFWSQLMLALYRDGRQGDALGAYRRAHAMLDAELGIEPGTALRNLHELILRHSPELELPVRQAPGAGSVHPERIRPPRGERTFVGREEELSCLGAALAHAEDGRGQLVVVESVAGLGKSALVERFATQATGSGFPVFFGRAWEEMDGPAFWPWVEVLRARAAYLAEPHDPAAADLIDLIPDWDASLRDPVQARLRLYQAVTHRLLAPGAEPVTVVLEDLHGADESSLQLLRFVLRHLSTARCLVVLTHRPVGTGHPLSAVLADAARSVDVQRRTLPPLSEENVRSYLEQNLGGQLSPELVAATIRRAEGHSFFLTEIVRMLRSETREGTVPHRDRAADLPRSVSEMIGRRFATLTDETLRLLLAASVMGREFDLRLLGLVTALDLDTVLDRVEEAAEAGLVQDLAGGLLGYRFDHALTQQTLYERLPRPRRVVLHARVADAMAAGVVWSPDGHLAELAHHRCASVAESGLVAAVDAAVAAAEAATVHLAHEEAARLYQLALSTHTQHNGEDDRTGELLIAVGEARARAGEPESARSLLLRAAGLARTRGDAHALAAAALGLGAAFERRGYDSELVGLLEEALAALPPNPSSLRARLLARLSMALNLHDPQSRALPLSLDALTAAREIGEPALEAYCLSARYLALHGPDDSPERMQCASETLRLAEAIEDRELTLDGLTWMVCGLLEHADGPGLEVRLARHAHLAQAIRHPLHIYYARMWQSTMAMLDGRAGEAVNLANEAFALGETLTELAFPRRVAGSILPLRYLGRSIELAAEVDRVTAEFPFFSSWRTGQAMLQLDLGDPEPAQRLLRELPEDMEKIFPRDGNWTNGMVALAEVVSMLEDRKHAPDLAELLLPGSGRMGVVRFGVTCAGPVDRALARLAVVCGDSETAERHFKIALRVTESLGARIFRAHTQIDYAHMLLRRERPGDAQLAHELLDTATAMADEMGLPGLHGFCKNAVAGSTAAKPEVRR